MNDDQRDELRKWWVDTADRDISSSLGKIAEYGGDGPAWDLIQTGHMLARVAGRDLDDPHAAELGILFYLRSKVARWEAAMMSGRRPSDDTLLDIAYYAMMARRVRAVGGWPVGPDPWAARPALPPPPDADSHYDDEPPF